MTFFVVRYKMWLLVPKVHKINELYLSNGSNFTLGDVDIKKKEAVLIVFSSFLKLVLSCLHFFPSFLSVTTCKLSFYPHPPKSSCCKLLIPHNYQLYSLAFFLFPLFWFTSGHQILLIILMISSLCCPCTVFSLGFGALFPPLLTYLLTSVITFIP